MAGGDLDAVGELYTLDRFRQRVVASEPMPAFPRGVGQLEDRGERGLVREAALRSDRPVAHSREGAFDRVGRAQALPMLGGEGVEGEQSVAIPGRTIDGLLVFRAVGFGEGRARGRG
jgi:hypothetical protein